MAAKITFDATNRKFVVTQAPDVNGVIEIDCQIDLYSDGKEDWQDDVSFPDLAKMQFPVKPIGGDDFGRKVLGASYLIRHGWSFKPYEADHTFRIVGNVGTQFGWELVDDTVGAYRVRVENDVSSIVSLLNVTSFEAGSFVPGKVALDVNSPHVGTTFPIGTRQAPVNNLADALLIAQERGLQTINVITSMTFSAGDFSTGYTFEGDSLVTVTVTLEAGANVMNCEFRNMIVEGLLDSSDEFVRCHIGDTSNFNGMMINCALIGTLVLGGGLQANLFDCYSGIPGGLTPTIDMGGSGQTLAMRNYHGGLKIINATGGGSDNSIDMGSGRIIFDSTVTAGIFYVRGVADIEDNSTGTATIIDLTINKEVRHSRSLLSNRQELVDTGADVKLRTYEDDGVTVFEENIVTDPSDAKPDLDTGTITKRGIPT